jgi:hypothetical protein
LLVRFFRFALQLRKAKREEKNDFRVAVAAASTKKRLKSTHWQRQKKYDSHHVD